MRSQSFCVCTHSVSHFALWNRALSQISSILSVRNRRFREQINRLNRIASTRKEVRTPWIDRCPIQTHPSCSFVHVAIVQYFCRLSPDTPGCCQSSLGLKANFILVEIRQPSSIFWRKIVGSFSCSHSRRFSLSRLIRNATALRKLNPRLRNNSGRYPTEYTTPNNVCNNTAICRATKRAVYRPPMPLSTVLFARRLTGTGALFGLGRSDFLSHRFHSA